MLEIIMIIASVTIMAKVASMEGRSSLAWGGLTFLLCIGSIAVIPLPLLNILIGLVASFVLIFAMKMVQD
ncbi:MAG: hypothetical protein ACYTF1_09725 [Planctomycetota bacterium]